MSNNWFNLLLSSVFRVTTGTYNSIFVILNVESPATLDITKFLVQFNSVYNFVLIKGSSNDLKKYEHILKVL